MRGFRFAWMHDPVALAARCLAVAPRRRGIQRYILLPRIRSGALRSRRAIAISVIDRNMLLHTTGLVAALVLGVAQAQQDRCESEFQNARPSNLPRLCWPGGSLSGNADDWSCSAECAAVFVPFWEACGETVLETTTLVGQDFAPFYNLCRAGMIGRAATPRAQRQCTSGNFNVRKAAAESACCPDADSCAGTPALPTHCSLQCAVAYSEFYEDCAAVAATSHSKIVNKMQQFHRTCIDETDTAELLIVLSDMPQNGCSIDTSSARATADGGMMAGGQVWLGAYVCSQGNTDLQLVIVDVSAQGMVNALFSFDAGSGCIGRYQLSGMMTDSPGGRPGTIKQLTLVPEQGGGSSEAGWIENACGYVSVGMSGTVSQADNGDLVYQGTIDFDGCDTFLVTLPTASPALFCPNTDAGWLLGSTMCYSRFEEAMSLVRKMPCLVSSALRLSARACLCKLIKLIHSRSLQEDAERFCQNLDGADMYFCSPLHMQKIIVILPQ